MSQRRTTSLPTLVSPHGTATIPEDFDGPQPLQADKELCPEGSFVPIEYGRHKHSIDHSAADHLPPTTSPARYDQELISPDKVVTGTPWSRGGLPEVAHPCSELPGDHPPHKEEVVGAIESVPAKVPLWKRRPYWVAAALFVIVAALAGGIAGGLHARRANSRQPEPFDADLCAVNWTIPSGENRHVLFTQDPDGSLIAYTGLEDNWEQVNISQRFDNSSLPIRPGSPLTAVAMSDPDDPSNPDVNRLHLYFTTRANSVVEIVTTDPTLQLWKMGELGPYMNHSLNIGQASQLASTWRRCWNATECGLGRFYLIYRDDSLMVADSAGHWAPSVAISYVDSNSSGLALMSAHPLDNITELTSDYTWAIYEDGGGLTTAWQDYNGSWEWTSANGTGIGMTTDSLDTKSLSAMSFRNRTFAFLAILDNESVVNGNYWDPGPYRWAGQQHLDLVSMEGMTFTTVALTGDVWLYGITSDGRLLGFEMDPDDPFKFWCRGQNIQRGVRC